MTNPNPNESRLMTAADIIEHKFTSDEHWRDCEAAYRRGVHQGLVLAGDLVDQALTTREARRLVTRAENAASEFRSISRHPGRPPVCDEIRSQVQTGRKKARVL